MLRKVIFISLIFIAFPLFAKSNDGYEVTAGYHYDVIDYDQEARQFFRHRHHYRSGGLELFLSHTLMGDYQHQWLNWFIALGGEEGLSLIGGSYSFRLGSGLFFGPRSYSSGDVLSWRESWQDAALVRPSASASPFYSLRGLVVGYRSGGMGLYCFGSFRERYITGEHLDNSIIEASPSSLNSHTVGEGSYREPVFMRNGGMAGEVSLGRYLFLQVFGFYGDITDEKGSIIPWQGVGDSRPHRGYFGTGAAFQYRDQVVSAYFEGGLSSSIAPDGGVDKKSWAVKTALRYRYGSGDLNFSMVATGKKFYAPGGGESMRPFSRGDLALRHDIVKNLSLRASANSETHRVPGGWHRSVPVTLRESAAMVWKPASWTIEGEVRHAAFEEEKTGWSRRYRLKGAWNYKKILRLRGLSTFQEAQGAHFSWSASADSRWSPGKYVTLEGSYAFCRAAEGNSVYLSTGSSPGRVALSSPVDGTRHVAAAGGGLKVWKIEIHGRCRTVFAGGRLLSWHIDAACRGKF